MMTRAGTRSGVAVALGVLLGLLPALAVPTVAATGAPARPGVVRAGSSDAPRVDDVLTVGERLDIGDALVSPNGRYRLEVLPLLGATFTERDSWLGPGREARLVRTTDAVEVALVLTDDGLYTVLPGGTSNYTGIPSRGATSARLQDDGNLVVLDGSGRVIGSSRTDKDSLVERGDVLLPGEVLRGTDGTTRLVMQTDGNLVLYRGGAAVWASGSDGHPGAGAVFQQDGNLVVHSSAEAGRAPLFDTGTHGAFEQGTTLTQPRGADDHPVLGARLRVDAGSFSLLRIISVCCRAPKGAGLPDPYPEVAWASDWSQGRVLPGDEMLVGDRRRSPDGRCSVVMQGDRNLVLYCDGAAVWASGVRAVCDLDDWFVVRTVLQDDGNLVTYHLCGFSQGERAGWDTGTRTPGSTLVVQDDRNLVLYAPGGRATWSARTGRL